MKKYTVYLLFFSFAFILNAQENITPEKIIELGRVYAKGIRMMVIM